MAYRADHHAESPTELDVPRITLLRSCVEWLVHRYCRALGSSASFSCTSSRPDLTSSINWVA